MTVKRPLSKAFIIISLFALLLLGFSTSGFSTIYYVNTAADAGGDGTTQELTGEHCAFKTIAQVNAASPAAGSSILFNKGNEWREQLTVPTSGSDGSPITYGAYGEGADPIINGSDIIKEWTNYSGDIWEATCYTEPNQVFFDGTRGNEEIALEDVDSAGDWYWVANVLYVYSTSDPDTAYTNPGIEASVRDRCIYANGKDYITVENLECKNGGDQGIAISVGNYWTVQNNKVHHCGEIEDGLAHNIVIEASNNNTIKNNETYRAGQHGIYVNAGSNNIIEHNEIYDNHHSQCDIRRFSETSTDGNIIRYNLIYFNSDYDCNVNASFMYFRGGSSDQKVTNTDIYYNVFYTFDADKTHTGIHARSNVENINIYNNSYYSSTNSCAISLENDSLAATVKNNIAKTQVMYVMQVYDSTNKTIDYNCWDNDSGTLIYVNDATGGDGPAFTEAEWGSYKSETGFDTHGINSDPLMIDPANEDFTLNPHSPCVNAGADVSLTEDYQGLKIRHAPDIGAHENQTNALFFAWNLFKQWWY